MIYVAFQAIAEKPHKIFLYLYKPYQIINIFVPNINHTLGNATWIYAEYSMEKFSSSRLTRKA